MYLDGPIPISPSRYKWQQKTCTCGATSSPVLVPRIPTEQVVYKSIEDISFNLNDILAIWSDDDEEAKGQILAIANESGLLGGFTGAHFCGKSGCIDSLSGWKQLAYELQTLLNVSHAICQEDGDALDRFIEWGKDEIRFRHPNGERVLIASATESPRDFAWLSREDSLIAPAKWFLDVTLDERLNRCFYINDDISTTRPVLGNTVIRDTLLPQSRGRQPTPFCLFGLVYFRLAEEISKGDRVKRCLDCGNAFVFARNTKRTCGPLCRKRKETQINRLVEESYQLRRERLSTPRTTRYDGDVSGLPSAYYVSEYAHEALCKLDHANVE